MYRHARSVLSAGLLLLLLVAGEPRRNYQRVLADRKIEQIFRLLGPSSLLGNEQIDYVATNSCSRDLAFYKKAIDTRENWALKMLDASSKIPSGIMEGNIVDLGVYDECVESRGTYDGVEISGRQCQYGIDPMIDGNNLPYSPTMSICLPDTCSSGDVFDLVNTAINAIGQEKNLRLSVASTSCANPNAETWSLPTVLVSILLCGYLVFLVLCTMCDLADKRLNSEKSGASTNKELLRFSLLRIAKSILSTEASEGTLMTIHGIRVLSTFWIILLHEYYLMFFGVNSNLLGMSKWFSSWKSVNPLMSSFSVDTFFVLSGFLMTHTFLKNIKKTDRFNVFRYYLHRYIRMTPPMAILLFLSLSFLPKIASGTHWGWLSDFYLTRCQTKWWATLLYVRNIVDTHNDCLVHLWSNYVDMQLFWLSPIILYPLHKRPKIGLTIVVALLLSTIIATAMIVQSNHYLVMYVTNEPDIPIARDAFFDIYIMPHTRAAPWLLGILLGYFVQSNIKLTKTTAYVGWVCLAIGFVSFACTIRILVDENYKSFSVVEMLMAGFCRPIWGLGICWVIFATIHGCAGPIPELFSWKYFLPLSRLSYCMYLVHFFVPLIRIGATRNVMFFSDYSIIHSYIGDLVISIVLAFFYSMLFEVPFSIMEDIYFKRKTLRRNKVSESYEKNNHKGENKI